MFRLILLCVLICGSVSTCLAQTRQWTDRSGNSLRATMTGVLEGKVVLKAGSKRHMFLLADFSLDDRDYIAEELKKRRQQDKLAALLQEAAKPPRIARSPTTTLPGTTLPGASATTPAVGATTEMYGLKIPSHELLQPESSREWTDLLGNTVTASFEQVVSPAHFRLRDVSGRTQALPIVNFVRSDIENVKAALAADLEREVFPANSTPMTDEQRRAGYRTWTDRKGVTMDAKLVRRLSKTLELEVDGQNREFLLHAVSEQDRLWVTAELARQSEQRRAEAAARAAAAPPPSSSSNPGGSATPGGRPSFGPRGRMARIGPPEYEFKCDHCGRQWTSHSPIAQCENCRDTYEFRCNRCGHEWTEKNSMLSECPRCAKQDSGGSSSGGSGYSRPGSSSPGSGSYSGSGSSSFDSGRSGGRIFRGLISMAVLAAAGIGAAVRYFGNRA